MKKRRRGKPGLASLAALPKRREVIEVKPTELLPIKSKASEIRQRPIPSTYALRVETEGEEGYKDRRAFELRESAEGWEMEAVWIAKGQGPMPSGFQMLGQLSGLFNGLFNMLAGRAIESQSVDRSGDPGGSNPLGLLFGGGGDELTENDL